MKPSDVLKRKAELKEEQKLKDLKAERARKHRVRNNKKECAQKIIDGFKKFAFDPDNNEHDRALTFIANGYLDSENSGSVCVGETTEEYEDEWGSYHRLLPTGSKLYPPIEECVPTKKVKPKKLREFFESVEKFLRADCWWGYGYIQSTSYTLRTTTKYNFLMHFKFWSKR